MSNLVDWAEAELERLVTNDDDGMQKAINKDILDVVKLFASQGHSGFSASYALNIIKRLLDWKPITPLTGEENEWCEVPEWDKGTHTQQNKRCSAVFRKNFDNSTAYYLDGKAFSDDGGKSWYMTGGAGGKGGSCISVTFPYVVPEKPEYIILDN